MSITLLLALTTGAVSPLAEPRLPAPVAEPYLISRELQPDGAVSECVRVPDPKPGWLPVTCSIRIFHDGSYAAPKTHVDQGAIMRGLIPFLRPYNPPRGPR